MKSLRPLIALLAICLSIPLLGGSRGYMKVEGITGENDTKGNEGWMEILSYAYEKSYWDQKMDQPSAIDFHEGARRGSEILITRKQEQGHPELFMAAADGRVIPEVKIEIRDNPRNRKGGEQVITYTLRDVWVKMIRVDREKRSPKASPIETLSLGFERVSWESSVDKRTIKYPTRIKRWH